MDWAAVFFKIDSTLLLAVIGVSITILIAWQQQKQLKLLDKNLERLQKDRDRRDRIEKYFKATRDRRYTIVYPSHFHGKPLESVHAGDYFAVALLNNALSSVLPEQNFTLMPISRHLKISYKLQDNRQIEQANTKIPDHDLIFICSPTANSMLKAVFPTINLRSKDQIGQLPYDEVAKSLPCWFVEDHTDAGGGKKPILKIWDLEMPTRPPLSSPAEDVYREAELAYQDMLKKSFGTTPASNMTPEALISALETIASQFMPTGLVQKDFAILMRINTGTQFMFVMAGIHQYGTWMAAKYLHDLFETGSHNKEVEEYVFGNDDFLMVIKGEFSHQRFHVTNTDIEDRTLVWRKRGDKWERLQTPR